MSLFVLLASLPIGITLAEIAYRTFGGSWFRKQMNQIGVFPQTFRETEGDDERQSLLLRSGLVTLRFGFVMLALFVVLAAIAYLIPGLLAWNESQQIAYLAAISIVATAWIMLQRSWRNKPKQSDYTLLERWLHWLALEPISVRHLVFDLERQFALPKRGESTTSTGNSADGAVYVCGLARSGTTMLLHILDDIDGFRSLTYRDMPFVLAPNLWKQISQHSHRPSVPVERAHGDNIHVHFDSPEGFEEVFWRTYSKRTPDTRCLGMEGPSPEALTAFAEYRAIVANPRDSMNAKPHRYLSKNNNNLLRLRSLCADPTATVLLVYRNPVATARSLHRQHQRFCAAQTEDRFTRTYMGWLAHHEFGLDHLPFCFAAPQMDASLTPDDPNYWLDYWNAVYCYILAQNDLNLQLVNHDALCAEPVSALNAICTALGIEADALTLAKKIKAQRDSPSIDGFRTELLQRAKTTHRALLSSKKNIVR